MRTQMIPSTLTLARLAGKMAEIGVPTTVEVSSERKAVFVVLDEATCYGPSVAAAVLMAEMRDWLMERGYTLTLRKHTAGQLYAWQIERGSPREASGLGLAGGQEFSEIEALVAACVAAGGPALA